MSLVILLIAEIIIWVTVNRNTPFSTPRLNILRDVTGSTAFFAGMYAALSYSFMPVTLIDPFHSFLLCLGNFGLWSVLAVRQHSMAHQH